VEEAERLEKDSINCWERSFDQTSGSSNFYLCDGLFYPFDGFMRAY